ncbi:MAG: hydrogenase maturation protease [Leptospiraceae bacterium]|nr:hydrogenase maturation protease [Leptospiraceae bacterium]MCB1314529.1 hydrogenase maturation protease [Leptospiraceae bacterium]MCB1321442.1 hydrogenase maturation protease [Leptospiraceae bacterium]
MRILILGIGNRLRGDDAVGPLVIDMLRGEQSESTAAMSDQNLPAGVVVRTERADAALLLDAWKDFDCVILIDAVYSGKQTGEIIRLRPLEQPLPIEMHNTSSHGLGLAEAIELGRAFGELPPQMMLYGIEGRNFDTGASPSAAVRAAAHTVSAEIRTYIRTL